MPTVVYDQYGGAKSGSLQGNVPNGTPPEVGLFDASDDSYSFWNKLAPPQRNDGRLTLSLLDDGVIPSEATINSVTAKLRVRTSGDPVYRSRQLRPGIGTVDGGNHAKTNGAFADRTHVWVSDVRGDPFTQATVFDTQYGIFVQHTGSSDGSMLHLAKLSIEVDYSFAAAVARTRAADQISLSSARLNGTINPMGANVGSPVSYYFEWGVLPKGDQVTAETGALTGSADIEVSETLTGLLPGTTYFFRMVANNGITLFFGDTLSFITGTSSIRLNEFRREATGEITKEARSLHLNLEFPQQPPHPNCDPEELLQDPPFEV